MKISDVIEKLKLFPGDDDIKNIRIEDGDNLVLTLNRKTKQCDNKNNTPVG